MPSEEYNLQVIKGKKMQEDDQIDEFLTQHAIFKIMDHSIIPCSCGAYRKVIQNKKLDSLLTQCSKCGSQEPFNIADLALLGGGLLKLAIADGNNTELKPPNVTYDQVYQIIEDIQNHEAWVKEIERQTQRIQLKVLKGGLSE
jgi:hypothetical protein